MAPANEANNPQEYDPDGSYEKRIVLSDGICEPENVLSLAEAATSYSRDDQHLKPIILSGILHIWSRQHALDGRLRTPIVEDQIEIRTLGFVPTKILRATLTTQKDYEFMSQDATSNPQAEDRLDVYEIPRKVVLRALGAVTLPGLCRRYGVKELTYERAILDAVYDKPLGAPPKASAEVVIGYGYVL